MSGSVLNSDVGCSSTSLYRRPSRLRRFGALLLTAGGALGVACGGSSAPSVSDPAQVWLQSDAATGLINMDDVQQAYRDAYTADGFRQDAFERRLNEIYEGDHLVLVRAEHAGDRAIITGWEDLNDDRQVSDGTDDKLFTITQELKDGGSFQTQGHGANGYYHSVSPLNGFLTGLLLGSLFTGGRTTYVTPPARSDDLAASRAVYRASGSYAAQQARNAAYGSSVGSRFGSAATTQTVSPARSSYQTRQINSGAFRSSGSSSRSISSGVKSAPAGGAGIQGGGGRLAL